MTSSTRIGSSHRRSCILVSTLFLTITVASSWAMAVAAPLVQAKPTKKTESPSENLQRIEIGLATITEQKVKETVSFLASDEMAGRATLSEGFEKAAEHVAQRFKAAGLQPVSGDSFFSTTEVPVTQTPSTGTSVKRDNREIEGAQLLSGGPQELMGEFKCHQVLLRDSFDEKFDGIAVVDSPKEAGGRRWLAQLTRLANRVRLAGGVAVVVRTSADAGLWDDVKGMRKPQKEDNRLRFMLPVLVVPEKNQLDGELITVSIPQQLRTMGEAKNVLAVLPGSDPELAKEFVLFSAHLDHLPPRDSGDDRIFNGADDNATGVTAVICLAEAFAKLEKAPKRSVLFMTFWGEESGLLGSKAFAENPDVKLSQIKANINIEMIGRPEAGGREKVWVTGWEKSSLGAIMVPGAAEVGVEVFEHPQFSAMLYARSDNYSLAAKGVVAHSFSAGSLHSDYHQVSDEWEKLELGHMTSVIRGLMAGAFPITDAQATPAANPE